MLSMTIKKIIILISGLLLIACIGEYPEAIKTNKAQQLWNLDDLVASVTVTKQLVLGELEGIAATAPVACKNITVNRMMLSGTPADASVDAHILLVPGIYESANSFNIIGREIIYQAKRFHNKTYQVWAMDRRSNCLEDLHGFQLAEQAATAEQAKDVMLDYYYREKTIAGKKFAGFLDKKNPSYLAGFGIRQVTQDIMAVLEAIEPERTKRQQNVFLGGHSLGAIHTSIFLSWDFDGSTMTLDDAGYRQVAGAISLDSLMNPVNMIPHVVTSYFPGLFRHLGLALAQAVSPAMYEGLVKSLEDGSLPVTATIDGLFTSEIIAFPEALGILAAKAPDEENTAILEVPRSPALKNILRLLNFSGIGELFVETPTAFNIRFSNEALVGALFDDDFSPIGFLGASLGHMKNGPLRIKRQGLAWLNDAPAPFYLLRGVLNADTQFYPSWAGNAFPFPGPIYQWADFEEIANQQDSTYIGIETGLEFTTAEEEMVDIQSLILTLYEGEGNLTEWYFPMRIFVDAIFAAAWDHGPDYGINTIHHEQALSVPNIAFLSGQGIYIFLTDLLPTTENTIVIPGMHHLDPLYEVNGRPDRHQAVVVPNIINFIESVID